MPPRGLAAKKLIRQAIKEGAKTTEEIYLKIEEIKLRGRSERYRSKMWDELEKAGISYYSDVEKIQKQVAREEAISGGKEKS